ncbi:MAG: YlmC/YmxH family sporulation protein [Ruminococcus sp.]|nr:YlmC/YmxH family sporulation protein [Ruminococcus sp.]MBR4022108.1 YlmC/YmxH family sporulation protein [Ruminococcus sp.]
MKCSLEDLKYKEVIDIENGEKLGFIDDVELSTDTFEIQYLIIYGKERLFGLLGRENDLMIPCSNIKIIGKDVVLVMRESTSSSYTTKPRKSIIESLLKN